MPAKRRLIIVLGLLLVATVAISASLLTRNGNFTPQMAGEPDSSDVGAVEAIASLYRLYPLFTDPDRRVDMTLQQRQQAEVEFHSLLNIIPLELLLPQMEKYSIASAEIVRSFENPRGFVNRVAEVAMNGIITPESYQKPAHGQVNFRKKIALGENSRLFSASNKTIFALFDTSAYSDTRVLVKWYHAPTGRIILFKQFEISDGDSNHIWIYDENGFDNGDYKVEVYRVNPALPLLTSGSYRIEN